MLKQIKMHESSFPVPFEASKDFRWPLGVLKLLRYNILFLASSELRKHYALLKKTTVQIRICFCLILLELGKLEQKKNCTGPQ